MLSQSVSSRLADHSHRGVDVLEAFDPVAFQWIQDGESIDDKVHIGFDMLRAFDAVPTLPYELFQTVNLSDDVSVQIVNSKSLVPVLVDAVRYFNAKIDQDVKTASNVQFQSVRLASKALFVNHSGNTTSGSGIYIEHNGDSMAASIALIQQNNRWRYTFRTPTGATLNLPDDYEDGDILVTKRDVDRQIAVVQDELTQIQNELNDHKKLVRNLLDIIHSQQNNTYNRLLNNIHLAPFATKSTEYLTTFTTLVNGVGESTTNPPTFSKILLQLSESSWTLATISPTGALPLHFYDNALWINEKLQITRSGFWRITIHLMGSFVPISINLLHQGSLSNVKLTDTSTTTTRIQIFDDILNLSVNDTISVVATTTTGTSETFAEITAIRQN
jgi:hypothetical protein